MVENESFILSNEFAAVRVEWGRVNPHQLQVTDLGSGAAALLNPGDVIYSAERDPIVTGKIRSVEWSVDYTANSPRLKIADAETGLAIYLDPLQLADAAVTGAWGKLPLVYDSP